MAITSKVQICNMAQSLLGNYQTVENIDAPQTDKETIFSLWYDIARQTFLKMTLPNFAVTRKTIAALAEDAPDPFSLAFAYPNDAVKILGVGSVEEKRNNYTVENGRIYTNQDYDDGLPIRYVSDYTDVTGMSPEFIIAFAYYLASKVAPEITQDMKKVQMIEQMLPSKISEMSALNAQENKPIRVTNSGFRESRFTGFPISDRKR